MITLSSPTAGATIYYTTDGSKPTTASQKYTGPLPAAGLGSTLKAIAVKSGIYPSETATFAITDNGAVFGDVDPALWYYPYINTAVTKGIMNGMGGASFAPQTKLTRGMMVQILYNMEGRPAIGEDTPQADPADGNDPAGGTDPEPADPVKPTYDFQDVQESDWFYDAVRWAAAEGIVTGYSDTEFGPRDEILREQLVTMLFRYADKYKHIKIEGTADLSKYTDGWSVRAYAQDAMKWAIANGIINGYSNGALDPHNTATRAEAAAMLVRYTDKDWPAAE